MIMHMYAMQRLVLPSYSGTGNVSITATSAHSILLSHNLTESGVYYMCNVTTVEGGVRPVVNKNVTTQLTTVTGLLPDTTYRVDCVAYHSDGVEYCLEANTTVTTRELHSTTLEQNKMCVDEEEALILVHLHAGPDKVQNVTIRGSVPQSNVNNSFIRINQIVTWDAPPNHHNILHYTIKYMLEEQGGNITTTSTHNNVTKATLELLVPRRRTPSNFTVQVAAVSKAGQGEFSEKTQFSYSSKTEPVVQLVHM